MAKKLNKLDLLKLPSIGTPNSDSVAFAAKSDGLYQKIGSSEEKLLTTNESSYIPLVIGTQTATTASWAGVLDADSLKSGQTIRYWLPRTSASGVTLNLTLKDGTTTGAINCYVRGTSRLTTHYPAGSYINMTYLEGALINGTAYTGWWAQTYYADGTESYTVRWNAAIKAGAQITRYKLLVQGSDGRYYPTTIGNTTAGTKTISTVPFLIGSPIIFYSYTTTIAAGGVTPTSYNYTGITTSNTTYAWNKNSGWRANEDVYLKGTVSGALFTLDSTTLTSHMTQDLPTTEDGFYYMRLGMFSNTTTGFRLSNQHPTYYFADGELQSLNTSNGADWDDIIDKPTTFTPSSHKHPTTDITGLGNIATINKNNSTANYLRGDGTWVTPPNKTYSIATTSANGLMSSGDKTKLNGIATSANNYTHPSSHSIDFITGLQDALDGKSATGHTHTWAQVTGKPSTFAPSAHSHSWSSITSKPTTFAPDAHTHSNISITAGTGLSGGGALSATRTLSIASTYAPNTSTSLGASKNLNDYRTAGFYHQTSNANATTALNYPVASAGALLVQTAAGVIQTYKVYNSSNVYVRGYYGTTWTAWRKLVNASDSIPWARISGAPATATTHPTWAQVTGKPSTFAPSAHTHTSAQISDATNLNTASMIVKRDSSGNFSAGTITAALTGNASSATKLATARNINGVSFDGSKNITITASTTATLTRGSYLTGSNFNGSTARTWAVDATSANTASKVVARNASGNFSAGTITATLSGNASSATKLATARTIGISGGVTGTATSFNGSANITIPITAMDASKLTTGTVPDARLAGVYTGFTHRIDGANTIFTTPSSGTSNSSGRTVFGLAEYRSASSAQTGAIVFIAPFTKASTIMKTIEIDGMLYSPSNAVRVIINNYTSGLTKKMSYGTVDIQVRVGETADGKFCVILGDVTTKWSYPHLTLSKAMFSHSSVADAYCYGWTTKVETSLTGYTNISAEIANSPIVSNITGNAASATKLQTARTINGTSFNGSANITTARWGTARNISIGGTTKSVNGSAAVTWATSEIAAQTAITLATSRTIWGQSFNGGANVSGAMTGITTLAMTGALTGATILNASQNVNTPKIDFGNGFTLEASGTQLVMKYNGVIRQRFLADGSIASTNELSAHQ